MSEILLTSEQVYEKQRQVRTSFESGMNHDASEAALDSIISTCEALRGQLADAQASGSIRVNKVLAIVNEHLSSDPTVAALQERLAEAHDAVRVLDQAIEVAKAAHVEMTYLDDGDEPCPVCEALNTVQGHPSVRQAMEEQDEKS